MLKPSDTNADLKLRFCVDRGKSMKLVENVVMTWGALVEKLSHSFTDKLTLAEFKELPQDRQNARKQNQGYLIGGQMKRGIRAQQNEQPRQLLTFDIDQGTPEILKALRDGTTGLGKCEYVVHSTRTHGDGNIKIRVIVPLAKLLPKEMYGAASRVGAWCIDTHMVAVDRVSFKMGQIMYWPAHCADIKPIFIHHKGHILDVQEMLTDHFGTEDGWKDLKMLPQSPREGALRDNANKKAQNPVEKRGVVGAFCRIHDIQSAIETFDLPYEPSEVGPDGVPLRWSYKLGTSSNGAVVHDDGMHLYSHHGSDPCYEMNVNPFDLTRIHLFGDQDIAKEKDDDDPRKLKSFKMMEEMLQGDKDVMAELLEGNYGLSEDDVDESFDADDAPLAEKPEVTSEKSDLDDDLDGLVSADWKESLDVNEKGTIKPTLRNIVLIIRNAVTFRGRFAYNEFTHSNCLVRPIRSKSLNIDIRIPSGRGFLPLEDHHVTEVNHVLSAPRGPKKTGWSLNVPQRILEQAIDAVCRRNAFHPVRDWLDGLEDTNLGESLIEQLWIKVCHTPDTAYHRASARNFLIGSVARIYEPGAKFDFMPVLIGLTGIRKSTFVKVLGGYVWATESEGHFDDKKKFVETSLGYWFIEHGEMQHFRHASSEEAIKAMLSGGPDTVRLSYRRNPEEFYRQFVIVGTTEDTQFLRSFHRRLWPIQCGTMQLDLEWLIANRDQLFAEAVAEYREMRRVTNGVELPLDLRDEAKAEFNALQPHHVMPDDVDFKAGLIREWLDTEVAESMSRCGADREDAADAMFGDEPMVLRTMTCAGELFEKALGGDLAKYDQRTAQSIGKAMRLLEPGWIVGERATCGKYGIQRTYRRVVRKPGRDL